MARKYEEKNIRKITKIGKTSYAVTLPVELIRAWRWKEKQKVVLEVDNKRKVIKIRDWRKRTN